MTTPNRTDSYVLAGGGKLVYLHFGQETPEEAEKRRALLQRVADSLGIRLEMEQAIAREIQRRLTAGKPKGKGRP